MATKGGDYIKNIQTIAKTDIILDKLNGIQQSSQSTKESLHSQRITTVSAAGNNSAFAGGAAGTPDQGGTDKLGHPVEAPLAPPPFDKAKDSPDKSHSTIDDFFKSLLDNNTDNVSNDQNGNAHLVGESDFAKQAKRNSEEIQAIRAALEALGFTTAQINALLSKLLAQEKGVDDISDVYNGVTGAQPASPLTSTNDKQNGFVGLDPLNTNRAFLVRTDEHDMTVSDTTWEQGFYWSNDGNVITADGFDTGVYNSPEQAAAVLTGLPTFNIDTTEYCPSHPLASVITSVSIQSIEYVSSTVAVIHTAAQTYQCGVGVGTTFDQQPSMHKHACGVIGTGSCALTARPLVPYNLKPDLVTFYLKNGKFLPTDYGLETPLNYQTGVSTITIKSAIDEVNYNLSPAINGGFMLYRQDMTGHFNYYDANRNLDSVHPIEYINFYTPRKINI